MINKAIEAIRNSSKQSSIYIGCDSIRYKSSGIWWASYCVVIIVHKDSKHGCNLFSETTKQLDFGGIRQRLMVETELAINAATAIIDELDGRRLEIHLDLNGDAKHKSNVAVKESLSWVRGMTGLEAKIKPEAFAATHAADHLVRQ